eukprot:5220451-Amphidinium_carterae.1
MEVGTGRKRAAEEEADDSERTASGEAADLMALSLGTLSVGKQGRGMLALSLLLAEGAMVLKLTDTVSQKCMMAEGAST